ncbi:hypothetical protein IWX90DRAFT_419867 [Phyllosticta citrichinensis]|uniref:Transmembrane protein n=1 Tax=Phyllosticta citrichinensis TaxID=1130410 RepID=A0ABR1Y5T5_9PEZI
MSTPAQAPPPTHLLSICACVCFLPALFFSFFTGFPSTRPLFSFSLYLVSHPSPRILWSSPIVVVVFAVVIPYHLALRIGGVINLSRRPPIDCFEARGFFRLWWCCCPPYSLEEPVLLYRRPWQVRYLI